MADRITHEEFKRLVGRTGLNIDEAAEVLDIGRDAIRIWMGDKKRHEDRRAHPSAVAYLKCILANPDLIPPNWPDRLLED